jgi:cardiolipin synthase
LQFEHLHQRDHRRVTIPNIITIFRFVLVPFVIMAMVYNRLDLAFIGFVLAGVSDGVDGFIARQFNQKSEIGAWLDPIADKVLLVSVIVLLGMMGHLPTWLVILVVSRDILIVGGVILQSLLGNPMEMKPLMVSKANTVAQIVLAGTVLWALGWNLDLAGPTALLSYIAAALTVASGAAYLVTWYRFVSSGG